MSKYTAEQVDAEADCLPDAYEDQAAKLRDYATLLRERESVKAVVTELPRYTEWRHLREKGVWSNGVPAWAKDHEGHMNDYRAAVAVIDELAAAVAPMLASARVPDGWQLVPVEPTDEMIEKGTDQHECVQGDSWYTDSPLSENDCIAIYKAMLAAAGEPNHDA